MLPDIKKFFNIRNPLFQFFIFLSIFVGIAQFDLLFFAKTQADQTRFLFQLIIAIVSAVLLYLATTSLLKISHPNPLNILISSLIAYILIHPSNPWFFLPLTVGMIGLGKYLVRYKTLPLFNPAALGLFLTYYLTLFLEKLGLIHNSLLISWWGADMQQSFLKDWPLINIAFSLILLFTFLYFVNKYNKSVYVATAFVTYSIAILLYQNMTIGGFVAPLRFLSATIFTSFSFLLLVMMTEPKTSPNLQKHQSIIGLIGGLVLFIFTFYLPEHTSFSFAEPFISTVLVMNLLTVLFKEKLS